MLTRLWKSFHNVYGHQIITLYTKYITLLFVRYASTKPKSKKSKKTSLNIKFNAKYSLDDLIFGGRSQEWLQESLSNHVSNSDFRY